MNDKHIDFEDRTDKNLNAFDTLAKAAVTLTDSKLDEESIYWKVVDNGKGEQISVLLKEDENKMKLGKDKIVMRPSAFITSTERDDFGDLKRDISDGKITKVSINKMVSHIIKNRT